MADGKFMATVSPHLHQAGMSIDRAMADVLLALAPVGAWAIIVFGFQAFLVMAVSVATAALTEVVARWVMRRKATLGDLSAVLTGLFLALLLPATTPLWIVAIGSFISVGVGKELFGGLGKNVFNPALFGRVALMISPLWLYVAKFVKPFWWKGVGFFTPVHTSIANGVAGRVVYKTLAGNEVNAVTSATPLSLLKSGRMLSAAVTGPTPVGATWVTGTGRPSFWSMFLGLKSGSLGEISVLLLILGGAYLIWRKTVDWRIPAGVLAGALFIFLVTWNHPLYQMLGGGIWLGAFYMATDWVTSPMTKRGKWIYAAGIGVFVGLIRLVSPLPEGVAVSILIWNALTVLMDRYVALPRFGEVKRSWINKVPVHAPSKPVEEKT